MNFINKSYKDKLRATYTLLMFLVLILLSALLYYQMNKTVQPIIGEIGVHVIDNEAQYFGQQFYNQRNILELISNTEVFKNGDFVGIKKEIDNQMVRYGDVLISMKFRAINGKEYNNNPRNIIISANYEKALLDGYELMRITQTTYNAKLSEYISTTGIKVTDNKGNIRGTLIINAEVKKLILPVQETKLSELGEMWIFDSFGNVIIDPNKKEMKIYDVQGFKKQIKNKTSGEVKIINAKGDSSYLTYSKIPNTEGLYLAMGIEHKDFSQAMQFLMFIILTGATLASVFIFLFANKLSAFVTKPLTRMVKIIQNSDGTNFIEIPKDLKESKDEIGILANTIDEMARNIRNNVNDLNAEIKERQNAEENLLILNNELEFRVEERTLALTRVTNNLSISEDRFRIALEAAHIGLYDSDFVNNGIVVNGVFLKLINSFEYKNGYIKESDWVKFDDKLTNFIYEDDILKVKQLVEDNLPGIQEDFYAEFRLKEDTNIWLSLSGQVVKKDEAGKIVRFIGVLQNISERKSNEVQLKSAKEEAEEASLAKSQFLANMSHEIRTPMNAIMGLTHLIGQSNLNNTQKNYISKIEGSSNSLLRIINDILDFSKIEAGKIEIEHIKFSLDKVLENISNLYSISATNKGIDINFYTEEVVPDILIGDSLRLEQVICNLTTNAIKFTKHGEVNVSVRAIHESKNKIKLHFSVKDTGIGLTNEQIGRLFTAFTQADGSMTRKYGGTGLGLAISKQLVELMNGVIWVESEYGKGSSFQFNMEFDKDINDLKSRYLEYSDLQGERVIVVDHNKTSLMPKGISSKEDNEDGQIKYQSKLINKNILLVEDNEINQLVAKDILEGAGIHVSIASNGEEAINNVRSNKFDVVLMDVQMPIMGGYEATKIIRKFYSKLELPIIAMTANALRVDREISIKAGMNDYITKPINSEVLFESLIKCLFDKKAEKADKTIDLISNIRNETLDMENTLLRLGNKKDLYKDLLNIYVNNYSDLVKELSDLMRNKKYDETKRFIHSLKSVTGNIGAMKLNNFIIQFEKEYESYDEEVIKEHLEIFFSLNEELLKNIKKVFSLNSIEKKVSANCDVYSELEQLLIVLKKARTKEIKERMDYLVTNTTETAFVANINEIKKLVDSYRFKEAKVMVEKLMEEALKEDMFKENTLEDNNG
ncbi:MAG TPA: ATP-binding protein [Clostridium sp.]|uniref:ATP-binding protein n=1 Tax=Clostridium sp. TaxID=1506 RepID=UPI002F93DE61